MDLRDRVEKLMPRARAELAELVAMRSVQVLAELLETDANRPRAGSATKFAELGFADARLARTADGSTTVLGFRPGPHPDRPTVSCTPARTCLAGRQPGWHTSPHELTERDGRWYGQGRPAATGTSSCISPRCARSATRCRSTSSSWSRVRRNIVPTGSSRSCLRIVRCSGPTRC